MPTAHAGRGAAIQTALRARRACRAGAYAVAVTALTRRHGRAVSGRAYGYRGLTLRGSGGRYLMDWPHTFQGVAQIRNRRSRERFIALLAGSAVPWGRDRVWAADPLRPSFDPEAQIAAVRRFGHTPGARSGALAGASAGALRNGRVRAWLARQPLDVSVSVLRDVLRAASRTSRHHTVSARHVALRSMTATVQRLVLDADAGGWLRMSGRDATTSEVRRVAVLLRAATGSRWAPGLRTATDRVNRMLREAPVVRYNSLPTGAFYPWPRDGHSDSRTVAVRVNKPATAVLRVFSPAGAEIASRSYTTGSGPLDLTWDGQGTTGGRPDPGDYRYVITVADGFNNRRHVAGIGNFEVAVDTVAPTVSAATVQYRIGKRKRYFRAEWKVREDHSPRIRMRVLLNGRGGKRALPLNTRSLRGGKMLVTRLPAGAYRVYLEVVDGSGNRTTRRLKNVRFR